MDKPTNIFSSKLSNIFWISFSQISKRSLDVKFFKEKSLKNLSILSKLLDLKNIFQIISKYLLFSGLIFSKNLFFSFSNNSKPVLPFKSFCFLLFTLSYNDIIAIINSSSKNSFEFSLVILSKKLFIFSNKH